MGAQPQPEARTRNALTVAGCLWRRKLSDPCIGVASFNCDDRVAGVRRLLCGLRHRVNPGRLRTRITPNVHPDRAAHSKQYSNYLGHRERSEEKAVVLGAHELDHEPLDSC